MKTTITERAGAVKPLPAKLDQPPYTLAQIMANFETMKGLDTDTLASLTPGAIAELLSQRVELLEALSGLLARPAVRRGDCVSDSGFILLSEAHFLARKTARAAIARAEGGAS